MFLCFAVSGSFAQWEIREFAVQPNKNPGADATFPGNFEKSRHKEIAWFVPGAKHDDRIIIIDLATGEMRWKSKAYYRISPTSLSVCDVDGDGVDELVFSGQAESGDDPSLFLVRYRDAGLSSAAVAAPIQSSAPIQSASGSARDTGGPSAPSSTATTPASTTETNKEVVALIPENAIAKLQYSASERGLVRIDIFDGQGDLVRTLVNAESDSGEFTKTWDGTNDQGQRLRVGTYFYKVSVGKSTAARKPVIFSR